MAEKQKCEQCAQLEAECDRLRAARRTEYQRAQAAEEREAALREVLAERDERLAEQASRIKMLRARVTQAGATEATE